MNLSTLGWSPQWDPYLTHLWTDGEVDPASVVRIIARHKGVYIALDAVQNEIRLHLTGRMQYESVSNSQLPAVGDWCLTGEPFTDESNTMAAHVREVLPRRSFIARMRTGVEADAQVLAANVDYVFIVTSANLNFNINRLRRYILLAKHGNVEPVIVLSKVDLAEDDRAFFKEKLEQCFPDIPNIATSTITMEGLEAIGSLLSCGKTGLFTGSSGVGKSTLVNALLSETVQRTGGIRQNDCKGRHTTSSAGLFFLPRGGMIIDTPGLREVHVLGDTDELDEVLPSVKELASQCHFTDCSHESEPGCEVQKALLEGRLQQSDLDAYLKLEREIAYSSRKLDKLAAAEERNKWKKIHKEARRNRSEKNSRT